MSLKKPKTRRPPPKEKTLKKLQSTIFLKYKIKSFLKFNSDNSDIIALPSADPKPTQRENSFLK